MQYWLMKSEPSTYGIDDLKKDTITAWEGVRNYQARNMMRDQMRKGDQAFFYHSNANPPGIVGIMTVCKEAYPDFTALDPDSKYHDPKATEDNPRWFMVDVKFKRHLKHLITLEDLKQQPALSDSALVKKGNRLSIMPMTQQEWEAILQLE